MRIILRKLFSRIRGNRRHVCGRDNVLNYTGARLRHVVFDIAGDGNRVVIGKRANMNNLLIKVRGDGNVLTIGDGCFIKTGELHLQDGGSTITISDDCRFYGAHIAATEGGTIVVGSDGLFAERLEIRNGDSHTVLDRDSGLRINKPADVVIEDHVWTGTGVTVLKGVRLGAGSVVGTGSVVTKPVSGHCLAAGVPAKTVRENIEWIGKRK